MAEVSEEIPLPFDPPPSETLTPTPTKLISLPSSRRRRATAMRDNTGYGYKVSNLELALILPPVLVMQLPCEGHTDCNSIGSDLITCSCPLTYNIYSQGYHDLCDGWWQKHRGRKTPIVHAAAQSRPRKRKAKNIEATLFGLRSMSCIER